MTFNLIKHKKCTLAIWLHSVNFKWNASGYVIVCMCMCVCARPRTALTQSPVPNQCKTNDHISAQSVYKLVWRQWL